MPPPPAQPLLHTALQAHLTAIREWWQRLDNGRGEAEHKQQCQSETYENRH